MGSMQGKGGAAAAGVFVEGTLVAGKGQEGGGYGEPGAVAAGGIVSRAGDGAGVTITEAPGMGPGHFVVTADSNIDDGAVKSFVDDYMRQYMEQL